MLLWQEVCILFEAMKINLLENLKRRENVRSIIEQKSIKRLMVDLNVFPQRSSINVKLLFIDTRSTA